MEMANQASLIIAVARLHKQPDTSNYHQMFQRGGDLRSQNIRRKVFHYSNIIAHRQTHQSVDKHSHRT